VPISLADIQRWDPEQINEVADAGAARARTSREKADELRNLSAFRTWSGDAADVAQEAITESRTKLELSAQEAFLVSLGASRAYQEAQAVTKEVRDLLAYAAEAPAVDINTMTNTVIAPEDVATVEAKIAELQNRITAALGHAEATDADLAQVLSAATGDDDVFVGTDTLGPVDPERRQASAKAFEEVFGRPPTSAADWEKASWLDPANDDPALKGTDSSVVVTHIKPVPGQGWSEDHCSSWTKRWSIHSLRTATIPDRLTRYTITATTADFQKASTLEMRRERFSSTTRTAW
jgi:hypothetical protein